MIHSKSLDVLVALTVLQRHTYRSRCSDPRGWSKLVSTCKVKDLRERDTDTSLEEWQRGEPWVAYTHLAALPAKSRNKKNVSFR